MMRIVGAFLASALLAGCASPAGAQAQCNDRQNVIELLGRKYGEAPVWSGVTNAGGLVEVFAHPAGGTWTMVVTTPQGRSCLVAAGEGWRRLTPAAKGHGA